MRKWPLSVNLLNFTININYLEMLSDEDPKIMSLVNDFNKNNNIELLFKEFQNLYYDNDNIKIKESNDNIQRISDDVKLNLGLVNTKESESDESEDFLSPGDSMLKEYKKSRDKRLSLLNDSKLASFTDKKRNKFQKFATLTNITKIFLSPKANSKTHHDV